MESAAISDATKELTPDHGNIDSKLSFGEISLEEMKDIIQKLERVQFFESLTKEVTGKIKDIAQEMVDFRKDLQKKIEPGIIEIAARDIPEASHQLEGINETLENSTMKIMDINDEQMEIAQARIEQLRELLSGWQTKETGRVSEIIAQQIAALETINNLSMSMVEPLSFQDLVGQRIQKIVKLVKSMELRVEDLIISFGIKIQKYREDPTMSYSDLHKEVEDYRSELKGPQGDGEGLAQNDIDALLSAL
jgi:chemotaxis regulatin CheY-phosphate phosphatase CheZ